MGLFDFLRSQVTYDVSLCAVIRKIVNENMNDKFDVINEDLRNPTEFPLGNYVRVEGKPRNIFVVGGARLGKTSLGEMLCLTLPERKIIISFKYFLPEKRDFDIGYTWIDISQTLINLWADPLGFAGAFRVAFYADANSRGLMIDTIMTRVKNVMGRNPKSFEEFKKILKQVEGGRISDDINALILEKIEFLETSLSNAKQRDVDLTKGNLVIDLGALSDYEESATFLAEYYLRRFNRLEEREQREEKIRIVIDEAWHLLANSQQKSIIGRVLLQSAYVTEVTIISQNLTHLDEEYRSHFGAVFCFRNNSDADNTAIEKGYGKFMADAVKKLKPFQFIDLKYDYEEEVIEVWQVNYERLQTLKLEAKARAVFNEPEESFVEEEPKVVREEKQVENFEEKIIAVLQKSEVAMYGYQIAKAIGLLPKDAVRIRQPLRNFVRDKKIKSEMIQFRKKEVEYYYISNTEQVHNVMIKGHKTEKGIAKELVSCGWEIKFQASHGVHGYDFLIEKEGKQIIIEVETGSKKTIGDFNSKVEKYDNSVIIVVPNEEQKERYSYLPCVQNGKAKIVLIPEIEEVLKNWQ